MAQESFEINSHVLCYHRDKLGISQEQLAADIGITPRQYQRIEKEGKTTRKQAEKLADIFGISLENLCQNLGPDNSLWFITSPEGQHYLSNGYHQELSEIRKKAMPLSLHHDGLEVWIGNDEKNCKKVTIKSEQDEIKEEWKFYPAKYNEGNGIFWRNLKYWEEGLWLYALNELLHDSSYHIFVDGQPLVPQDKNVEFTVSSVSARMSDFSDYHSETTHFESWEQLEIYLTDCLVDKASEIMDLEISSEYGELIITYTTITRYMNKMTIIRTWMDEAGDRRQAPWPERHREATISSLEKAQKNRDKFMARIAVWSRAKTPSGDSVSS